MQIGNTSVQLKPSGHWIDLGSLGGVWCLADTDLCAWREGTFAAWVNINMACSGAGGTGIVSSYDSQWTADGFSIICNNAMETWSVHCFLRVQGATGLATPSNVVENFPHANFQKLKLPLEADSREDTPLIVNCGELSDLGSWKHASASSTIV